MNIIVNGFRDFEKLDIKNPHNKGVYLKTLCKRALKEVNKEAPKKGKLQNLWQKLGFGNEVGAYADYIQNPEKEFLWRRYINNESGYRSLFRETDKIKLLKIMIEQSMIP